jgi:dihydroorotate dehydrogenase electron transfer subunit
MQLATGQARFSSGFRCVGRPAPASVRCRTAGLARGVGERPRLGHPVGVEAGSDSGADPGSGATAQAALVARARADDVGRLARLAAAVLPGGWSEAALSAEIARSDAGVWVARADGEVRAGAIARRAGDDVELLWIAVAPRARRRGLGAALVAIVADWARELGGRVLLEVRGDNAAARALYARAGFVVVGRRPRYYRDGEDALLLASVPSAEATPLKSSSKATAPGSADAPDAPALPLRVDAEVVRNEAEGGANHRLVLACPGFPGFAPGQFAMLSAGARTRAPRFDPLLPRPMAIYRARPTAGGAEVEILYKIHGRGTALLSEALPGQRVRLVGPLGTPFPRLPDGVRAVLVGGGTGIASLLELATRARARGPVSVLLGARSCEDLMGVEDFEGLAVALELATEDGSRGTRGLVTKLLEAALAADPDCVVHACGPTPMMRACAELAERRDVRCLVSLENTMACGFGVCLGCAAPLAEGGYALVCRRGPVFDSREVAWEGLP